MLPDGWKEVLLDEVAKRGSGHTPNKNCANYWNGGVKWVSLADSSRLDSGLITETDKEISALGVKNSSAVIHPSGAVVLSRDAGVGKSGVLASEMAVSQHFIVWDCSASVELNNWYLYYWLQFKKAEFERVAVGSTIKTIGLGYFKKLKIVLPSLEEQRGIVEVLSTWDQAITTVEGLLANTYKQKLGLMQGLLTGRARLNGHSGIWQEYSLGELLSERIDIGWADLPLLSVTREQGVILRGDTGRKDTSNEDKSKYLRICPGDIGYNTMRMWQGVSALSDCEGIISPAYTVLVPGELVDGGFASFLFKLRKVVFLFYRYSQGLVSDTWTLKYKDFSKVKVCIPGIHEQRDIASVLRRVDRKLDLINRQLVSLRNERAALMSQLFAGKRCIRLSETQSEHPI